MGIGFSHKEHKDHKSYVYYVYFVADQETGIEQAVGLFDCLNCLIV